ncbi:cytochrome protein [Xylogone sp. PMI_703]|nr:cytochrome protein [Xylogone sp. PMI_703]
MAFATLLGAMAQLSTGQIFASVIVFYLLYTLCIWIYRLTLHPLAKYPGPLLAKVTNWYSVYYAFRGDIHIDMWRCHEKYGDVVRYAPNRLLVNNVNGIKDVYSHSSHVKKGLSYSVLPPTPAAVSTISAVDKVVHGKKRRIISQGLSESAIKGFEPAITTRIRKFCSLMAPENDHQFEGAPGSAGDWSTPRNMAALCNYLTFDIMASIAFGRDFELLDNPKNRYVMDAIFAVNKRASVYIQYPELAKYKLERLVSPSSVKTGQKFLNLARQLTEQRMQESKSEHMDIFSLMVDARDPETGQGFSMSELWAEAKFLIVAGSDTTSTAIAAALFYITRDAAAQQKAAAEVRNRFSSLEDIRHGPELSSCIYLRACVEEALRLSPPAGGSMWREVEENGIRVDGNFIPAGYEVGTSMYAVHHRPDYYPEPFKFVPERWLAEERSSMDAARSAYIPFSTGPRSCPGRGLAYMELMVTLGRLIWEYDMKVPDGLAGTIGEGSPKEVYGRHRVGEFQLKDHLTGIKEGPMIQFRRRQLEM